MQCSPISAIFCGRYLIRFGFQVDEISMRISFGLQARRRWWQNVSANVVILGAFGYCGGAEISPRHVKTHTRSSNGQLGHMEAVGAPSAAQRMGNYLSSPQYIPPIIPILTPTLTLTLTLIVVTIVTLSPHTS